MRRLSAVLVVLAVLCGSNGLRNAECAVACRWAGFDDGCNLEDRCRCIEDRSYDNMVGQKRLRLPSRQGSYRPQPEKTLPRMTWGAYSEPQTTITKTEEE